MTQFMPQLIVILVVILAGPICGITALVKVQNLRKELAALRAQLQGQGSSAFGASKDRATPEVKSAKPGEM